MKATNLCREPTGKVLKDRLGGHGNIGHISDQRSWYRVVTKSTVKNEKSFYNKVLKHGKGWQEANAMRGGINQPQVTQPHGNNGSRSMV